ncbi:serine/threonine-protein kinase [Kitasatospora sp. NPDC050467]|uniref:serine/threonine-protein kinase n=1 Tax=unclassified Kitasatospora TaxID=2633591 RepID=UPI003251A3C0
MDVSEGTVIAGRYRLAERLGGGGMGEVWKARDQRLQVEVAAKRLILDPYATPEERRTALAYAVKESRHAAALRTHPNVVAVHDVVEDEDGIPWTVMDLIAGRSLAQAVAAGQHFGPAQAARIGMQVLAALAAAHEIGIVHRDVKPGNIMLADDGRILLVDFGIAKHHADTRITRTGLAVGTVEYMAPERFDNADGPAGDLWALGVTLYEAVGGGSPFRRDSLMATIRAIGMDDPPAPASAGWLAEAILRLLGKDPNARPTIEQTKALLEHSQDPGTVVLSQTVEHPPTQLATGGQVPKAMPPLTTAQAELFDRAVRLADSIDDPDERADALFQVGWRAPWLHDEIMRRLPSDKRIDFQFGLAFDAGDVGLTRRLLEQSEPLIALIPDPVERARQQYHRIVSLSQMAELMAEGDPGGARKLMEQVESAARDLPLDPDNPWFLPLRLVQTANAGRRADPHASRRLTDLAEQRALSLAEEHNKQTALAFVSAELAPVDPHRAERLIGMITVRCSQAGAWKSAIDKAVSAGCGHVPDLIDAAELALVGPALTAKPAPVASPVRPEEHAPGGWWRLRKSRRPDPVAEEVEEEPDGTDDLVGIAVSAAAADTARAQRLAYRITDHVARAKAFLGMAGQVAASNRAQARHWLVAAHRAALQIPPYAFTHRSATIGEIVAVAAMVDLEYAAKIAERLVSDDLGHDISLWTLIGVAGNIAAVDPAQAVRLVDRAELHRDARTTPLDRMQRSYLAHALVTAAVTTVGRDLQHAKDLIRRAWETVHRPPAVNDTKLTWRALEDLIGRDLHAAEQLLGQLPGSGQDPLLVCVVTALTETDPLRAEQTARRITNDTLRRQALLGVTLSIAASAQGSDAGREF